MFDKEIHVNTFEAARQLAVARCLVEARGELIKFPSDEADHDGKAVWAGLVTEITASSTTGRTYITCLNGCQFSTSLSVDEAIGLVKGGMAGLGEVSAPSVGATTH
jgi:hypothetical protein